MSKKEPFIAGWKKPSDWHSFRDKLSKEDSKDLWQKAFEVYFKARLDLRYFNPINVLKENGTFEGEGFSIMAILCTLIEFLESTVRGLKYKFVRNKEDLKKYEYNTSSDIFIDFLSQRAPFSSHFDKKSAFDFYRNVRCGLLHEAHTKDGWTIWAKSPDGAIVNKLDKIVYRDDFKKAFDEYIEGYGVKLLTDNDLQKAFIRKFDFICEET